MQQCVVGLPELERAAPHPSALARCEERFLIVQGVVQGSPCVDRGDGIRRIRLRVEQGVGDLPDGLLGLEQAVAGKQPVIGCFQRQPERTGGGFLQWFDGKRGRILNRLAEQFGRARGIVVDLGPEQYAHCQREVFTGCRLVLALEPCHRAQHAIEFFDPADILQGGGELGQIFDVQRGAGPGERFLVPLRRQGAAGAGDQVAGRRIDRYAGQQARPRKDSAAHRLVGVVCESAFELVLDAAMQIVHPGPGTWHEYRVQARGVHPFDIRQRRHRALAALARIGDIAA